MKQKKNTNRGQEKKRKPVAPLLGSIVAAARQRCHPAVFRINEIPEPQPPIEEPETESSESPQAVPVSEASDPQPSSSDVLLTNKLIAEYATCLWYLKTKYFKKKWSDSENGDDDPRARRALGRISKCVELMKKSGIEVHDPTNERYRQGSEGMMRPIELVPTAGLTYEIVSETVSPIIWCGGIRIQPGEVFVAVPKEEFASRPHLESQGSSPVSAASVTPATPPPDAAPLAPAEGIPLRPDEIRPPGALADGTASVAEGHSALAQTNFKNGQESVTAPEAESKH